MQTLRPRLSRGTYLAVDVVRIAVEHSAAAQLRVAELIVAHEGLGRRSWQSAPSKLPAVPTPSPRRNPRMEVALAAESLMASCHESSWDAVCVSMQQLTEVFAAATVA